MQLKLVACLVTLWCVSPLRAQVLKTDVQPLIRTSCIHCHGADTESELNLESLGHDLSDAETFRKWERIFDRVRSGEMPPESEERPDPLVLQTTLTTLKQKLRAASLAKQQRVGRVPARRLTKTELGHTLRDLLRIKADVTSGVPDEVESGSFDTVGATQRISAVHMESYLNAADESLDHAIHLGRNPYRRHELDFVNSAFLNEFHDKPLNLGGSVSRKLEDGVALFRDVDYLITSFAGGFHVATPGVYRITSKVSAYQSTMPITLKMIRKEPSGSAELLTTHELAPNKMVIIIVSAWLQPGDTFYTTFQMEQEPFAAITAAGGSQNYTGPGISIRSQEVEGPLSESWPSPSTQQLLHGTELVATDDPANGPFQIKLSSVPVEHVAEIVERLAPRAFRRPPRAGELESIVALAAPAIEEKRDFVDVLRVPLRSLLSSPQFLMFGGEAGELDDYALANRLSYFLWKSMPDDELFELATAGKLSDRDILSRQIDRLLVDAKSSRFVRDFLGQWLLLYKVNATTPDENLYPEYDELLGDAIPRETELFFAELIKQNLSVTNLIDSEFTFVNRRLAEHYGIEDVTGHQFRSVDLPDDSPRGGVLTHAAVLKTTANGTVTSPVMRGNFVLTSLLGTPPSPPPPGIGSIEPDTRGKTTIREILAAHRNIETCAKCHREIDPPGFALESFDPIGGFRTNYRATANGSVFSLFGGGKTYKMGPVVDASGVTADGKAFSGIAEFKQHLLANKEQVARNFVSRLVVYSTGGEIQFADRAEIDAILDRTREKDFLVRDIIHEVVRNNLFRNK